MRPPGAAALTDALLVVKGQAAPSRPVPLYPQRQRRAGREDARLRVPLRLDEARHRKLRIAAAHFRKSAQAVMMAALDHYLDRIVPSVLDERCECLCGHGGCNDTVVPLVPRAP
jgi:hypothetical protein